MHPRILHNGRVVSAAEPRLVTPGQVGLLSGWGVFSTLRVADGVLFAYERHFARMRRDAALLRVPFHDGPSELHGDLLRLVEANSARNATLRVAVVRNRGGMWETPGIERPFDTVAFTADLKSWGDSASLGVVPQARHAANAFAGTKVLSWAQNLAWHEQAHEQGHDEVVLLNERDEVSECTSANLFAVFGSDAVTPPLTSGCLPGVTRELLVDGTVQAEGIAVRERTLRLADLEKADEVFITSSTRDLMPVRAIAGLRIRRNGHARSRLQAAFLEHVSSYVGRAARLPVAVRS